MAQLSVHDLPRELWEALKVDRGGSDGTYWKVLDTPSIRLVFFEPVELRFEREGPARS